nr:cysteine-rich hydrophobic domain-containing protein 1-like isoform X2 [Neodiprion pinetum]
MLFTTEAKSSIFDSSTNAISADGKEEEEEEEEEEKEKEEYEATEEADGSICPAVITARYKSYTLSLSNRVSGLMD